MSAHISDMHKRGLQNVQCFWLLAACLDGAICRAGEEQLLVPDGKAEYRPQVTCQAVLLRVASARRRRLRKPLPIRTAAAW